MQGIEALPTLLEPAPLAESETHSVTYSGARVVHRSAASAVGGRGGRGRGGRGGRGRVASVACAPGRVAAVL